MKDGIYREVGLERVTLAYSEASIEFGDEPLITTAPQQWSYAASIPLDVEPDEGPDVGVQVRLRVIEGRIGVGVLSPDERSFLAEQIADQTGQSAWIVVRFPYPALVGRLIVRNVYDQGCSKVVLEQVAICRVPPGQPASADGATTEPSQGELPELIQSLAYLRPLVPYPGWRFDADWHNSDFSFQTRRRVWEYCLAKGWEISADLPWYGSRVQFPLLCDTGRQLFVGGCFDPNEFVFLNEILKPGMVVFDVGANVGLYTVFAAQRIGSQGQVWAFEPSSREFSHLRHNVRRNDLRNVHLAPAAIGERNGSADLLLAEPMHAGQNSLRARGNKDRSGPIEHVDVRRLDDLVRDNKLSRVDAIKVDVEGAELEAFEGARETLQSKRPWLLFEVETSGQPSREERAALLNRIQSLDYVLYQFDRHSGLLAPASLHDLRGNLVGCPAGKFPSENLTTARKYYFGDWVEERRSS